MELSKDRSVRNGFMSTSVLSNILKDVWEEVRKGDGPVGRVNVLKQK